MDFNEKDQIRFNKQSKQHALETFSFEFNNKFDRPIDKLIKSLIEERNQISEKYQYHSKIQKEKSEDFWELQDRLNMTDLDLETILMDHLQDLIYLEDEIIAICETKIIYGFKHFEISLKKLLRIAFGEDDQIKKFKWHELIYFFKQKNIEISKLKGFDEINQMRIMNNVLKHSDEKIDVDIRNFPEFINKNSLHFPQLIEFYKRVRKSPEIFLTSLSNEIQKYLYDFSDSRLENLAEYYALRMEKKDADKFITILKSKY
ncbi:hypothetical protein [Altibacter sp. HG106]|uniref:hypothetical protein n=1 Tax=Altibacter sp. HG106 TaxID=3023937 RepID=UPI0023506336|nr:hypothetical protein [Altibacter sp. HG106]MDC7996375.1 hypothetical protein [Altibacter sp. HG106]